MTELAERDEYLAAGAHIGMQEKNDYMLQYIFKKRPDGLCVIDVEMTDERIKDAAKFLARFDPEKVLVVSRKEAGHEAVEQFSEATGIRSITGRFLPGALTNPDFDDYFETDAVILTDPVSDNQALQEAKQIKVPIVAMCDTYNDASFVDMVVPTNNKGRRALGLVYYLLAREILKERGEPDSVIESLDPEDFRSEEEEEEEH